MADLAVLKELFEHDILGQISSSPVNNRRFTRLKELGIDARLKTVDLMDIPDDSVVLKMDTYQPPSTLFQGHKGNLFRGHKGENKRCDYVVITSLDSRDILLFIEIKSSHFNDNEVQQQFMGAECAIDYCNAVLKRFYKRDGYFDSFDKRFVVFYKAGSISKTPTRIESPNNIFPSGYLKYPNPHEPSIRKLVGL